MKIVHTQCCGMRELDCVGGRKEGDSAEQALENFFDAIPYLIDYDNGIKRRPHLNFSLVTFTGVTHRVIGDQFTSRSDNYGQAFADLVVKEGLGEVVAGPETVNPNTQNTIRCWIWKLNMDRVRERAQQALDRKQAEERRKADDARRTQAASSRGTGAAIGTYGAITRSDEPLFRGIAIAIDLGGNGSVRDSAPDGPR